MVMEMVMVIDDGKVECDGDSDDNGDGDGERDEDDSVRSSLANFDQNRRNS